MTDYIEEIKSLRDEIERQRDEMIKQRRSLEDILYNLDCENMPAVTSIMESYQSRSADSIAKLEAMADEAMARIGLVVSHTEEGNEVRASVIVEAINNASNVTISADKINLNGAVSANQNFKIKTDGSVECKDITISGGEIHIPAPPADGTPILSVYASDNTSSVGLFPDRIEFEGAAEGAADYASEAKLDNRRVKIGLKQTLTSARDLVCSSDFTAKRLGISASEVDAYGDPVSGSSLNAAFEVTPYNIRHSYIANNPLTEQQAAGMRRLYIDSGGNIYAV